MKFEFKNPFAKKPPVSDSDKDKTKKALRDSQREFEQLSRQYEAQMVKLRELVTQASRMDKNSAEYKSLQHQAVSCKQKADTYEKGMRSAYAVLEKNRQFENMLENGMTISRLNEMLPDPDEAERLLQKLSDIAQEFSDKQEELDDLFRDYSEEFNSLFPKTDESAFLEFDKMVDAQRLKNEEEAQKAADHPAETAAPVQEPAPSIPETEDPAPEKLDLPADPEEEDSSSTNEQE